MWITPSKDFESIMIHDQLVQLTSTIGRLRLRNKSNALLAMSLRTRRRDSYIGVTTLQEREGRQKQRARRTPQSGSETRQVTRDNPRSSQRCTMVSRGSPDSRGPTGTVALQSSSTSSDKSKQSARAIIGHANLPLDKAHILTVLTSFEGLVSGGLGNRGIEAGKLFDTTGSRISRIWKSSSRHGGGTIPSFPQRNNPVNNIRLRMAFKGLLLTIGIWFVLTIVVYYLGALWPHATFNPATCFEQNPFRYVPENCVPVSRTESWFNFLLFVLVVEFLWLKSWMMGKMTRELDTLGAALISANLMFSIVYLYSMLSLLFPQIVKSLIPLYILRAGIVVILAWGIIELLLVRDPEPEPVREVRWENT